MGGIRFSSRHRAIISASLLALLGAACSWGSADGGASAAPESGIRIIGSRGDGPVQFDRPRALVVLPDGSFWVADMTGRIQSIDAEGKHRLTIALPQTQLGRPTGLAIARDGNLLVAETHYSRISRYSQEGKLLQQWGEPGKGEGQFGMVTGLAVDPEGNIFALEHGDWNDRIQKFSPEGEFLLAFGSFGEEPGQFRRPAAADCDEAGNLYVADAVNHRIQKFDGEGNLIALWGGIGREPGKFRYPYGITLGPDEVVYTCEFQNNRVQAFTRTGEFLGTLGRAGTRPGEFLTPKGIAAAPGGVLLVADTNNHRIQRIPGAFWKKGS